jgi:hypothetical protein
MIDFKRVKEVLSEHPLIFLLSSAMALCSSTFYITKSYLQDRFDYKIEEYKDDFAALSRRYNSKSSIDLRQITINRDSTNQIQLTSEYHADDNFYSHKDDYWTYKYTSPIELTLIANGMVVPDAFRDNPVDLPTHAWLGKGAYIITDKSWDRADRPELDTTTALFAEVGDTILLFHSDPKVFQPLIILNCLKRSKNSFMIRDNKNFTKKYSIDLSEISKSEILGNYVTNYMRDYFQNIPIKNISRNIISLTKDKNMVYASFVTEYNDLEINGVMAKRFFVRKEFIAYCSDTKLYLIEIQIPSYQPRKNGASFEQVNQWFKGFGIIEE